MNVLTIDNNKMTDMKNIKIFKTLALSAIVLLATLSCSETDYMQFDSANNGVYFTKDSLNYSFSVTPVETRTYTYKVPFRIMGGTSDKVRKVAFRIDDANTSAKAGVQYNIGEALVLQDSIDGYIPVEILRDGLEGSYEEGYVNYSLELILEENEDFCPTLDPKSRRRILTFNNAIEQPNWLDYRGNKVWETDNLGVWHPLKLIKMVEFFHELQNTLPETYKKMVAAYGENLESIPYGDPYVFRTIFQKYIYSPMYDYFNDPANYDYIISLYPDFPFDFPNPF